MKKTFVYIMAAVAAIAAVSCNKIENEQVGEVRIFTASFAPEVRTTLGTGNAVSWAADDQITVMGSTSGNKTISPKSISEDGKTATFEIPASIQGTVYAIHGGANPSISGDSITFTIPKSQDGSFNQANICVAKADSSTLAFKNATAILHFSNLNKKVSNGYSISKVVVGTTQNLSVSFSPFNVTSSENADIEYTVNGVSDCYFAVAPASCSVSLTASKGSSSSVKSSNNNGKPLSTGEIISINASGDNIWKN